MSGTTYTNELKTTMPVALTIFATHNTSDRLEVGNKHGKESFSERERERERKRESSRGKVRERVE